MKLEGKVAIVTGGGQGIGQAIVHCLAEEGASVAVIDINKDAAKKVADEIKALSHKSLAIVADVTDSKQATQSVLDTVKTFGKIDILVNDVGGWGEKSWARTSTRFLNQEEVHWDESFAINLKSQVFMCQAVIPYFVKQKSGKILNLASISGKVPPTVQIMYGVVKAGVINLTQSLAKLLGEDNINVNAICPGGIYTSLMERFIIQSMQNMPETEGMTTKERFLKGALAQPLKNRELVTEDIGRAVVFLVSEDARAITGQSLNVDLGQVMD